LHNDYAQQNYICSNYTHVARDMMVTEFGIADLRGKTDQEIIHQLLNITDSRFQPGLAKTAKENGKISCIYTISAAFKKNRVEEISKKLRKYKEHGLFKTFPFGTDLTDEEIFIGKALKILKKKKQIPTVMIGTILKAFFTPADQKPYEKYLRRMKLDKANSFEEKLYQKLLSFEFSKFEKTDWPVYCMKGARPRANSASFSCVALTPTSMSAKAGRSPYGSLCY
jgi:hypothetical protein